MKKPFFSIITCTYNSEKFLQDNIDSVKSQTFKDYEHIFIDGFSSDKTLEIINKYKLDNPGKVRIFNAKPRGMVNAMNIGTRKSKGKYLIHLHSDDTFASKNVLDYSVKLIEQLKIDWFFGAIKVLRNRKIIGVFPRGWQGIFMNSFTLQFYNFIPHQSTFINKTIFNKFGLFDENIPHLCEYDFWLRIAKNTRWTYANFPITKYRQWEGSSSFNKENVKKIRTYRNIIQKKYIQRPYKRIALLINFMVDKYSDRNMHEK